MSTLKAEVVRIDNVLKHPKADRLDIVVVKGWNCITSRVQQEPEVFIPRYSVGDSCIYLPIDSVLPKKLEDFLFPPDSKVKLRGSRLRTEKIRGCYSQGMVVDLAPELLNLYPQLKDVKVGEDVTKILGVTKYEPPAESVPKDMQGKQEKLEHPDFHKYIDIENIKNHNTVFRDNEMVYVTEKLHGTSARFAKLNVNEKVWWRKLLKGFNLLPRTEFCFGSRNVQYKGNLLHTPEFKSNVYARIARDLNLEDVLRTGETLYGEIVGSGIQGGYTYGCKEGQIKFFAYDVMVDGKYLSPYEFLSWCENRNIPHVPVLDEKGKAIDIASYRAYGCDYQYRDYIPMSFSFDLMQSLTKGDSTVGNQKIREGVVIKSVEEENSPLLGRKVLKFISDDYLHKEAQKDDSTDFH